MSKKSWRLRNLTAAGLLASHGFCKVCYTMQTANLNKSFFYQPLNKKSSCRSQCWTLRFASCWRFCQSFAMYFVKTKLLDEYNRRKDKLYDEARWVCSRIQPTVLRAVDHLIRDWELLKKSRPESERTKADMRKNWSIVYYCQGERQLPGWWVMLGSKKRTASARIVIGITWQIIAAVLLRRRTSKSRKASPAHLFNHFQPFLALDSP